MEDIQVQNRIALSGTVRQRERVFIQNILKKYILVSLLPVSYSATTVYEVVSFS